MEKFPDQLDIVLGILAVLFIISLIAAFFVGMAQ